jgi:hypothetical protein
VAALRQLHLDPDLVGVALLGALLDIGADEGDQRAILREPARRCRSPRR